MAKAPEASELALLLLVGSAREKSNTARIAASLNQALTERGAAVDVVDPRRLDLRLPGSAGGDEASTRLMADPAEREKQFERAMRQVKFDKVYIEVYRDHNFATDAEIEAVKKFFVALRTGPMDRRTGDDPDYKGPERRADRRGSRAA